MSGQTSGLTDAEVKTQAAQHVIRKNYDKIMLTITVEDVVPTLFSNDVIGEREKQVIQAGKTQFEKSEALADCFLRKSGEQFEQFCSILEDTRMFAELVHTMNGQYGEAVTARLEEENLKGSAPQIIIRHLQQIVSGESPLKDVTPPTPPDSPIKLQHFTSAPGHQQDASEMSEGHMQRSQTAPPLRFTVKQQEEGSGDVSAEGMQPHPAPARSLTDQSSHTSKCCNCNAELLMACENGKEDAIESIMGQHCLTLDVTSADEANLTPLHHAVKNKLKRGLSTMAQHSTFALNVVDKDGKTPLHYAAQCGDMECLQALHCTGHAALVGEGLHPNSPLPVNIQDKDGNTALHLAVEGGHIDAVKTLVQDYQCSTAVENNNRQKPAYLLVNERSLHIIEILVQEPLSEQDADTIKPSNTTSEEIQGDFGAIDCEENTVCGTGSICTEEDGGCPSELVVTDTARKPAVSHPVPKAKGDSMNKTTMPPKTCGWMLIPLVGVVFITGLLVCPRLNIVTGAPQAQNRTEIEPEYTWYASLYNGAHRGTIKLPPMPIELQVISSDLLKNKIYITGIATEKQASSSQVQVYSIREGKWSTLPEAPNHNAPIAVIDGRITLIGGRAAGTNKPTNILSTWFEEEGQWKHTILPMPSGRVASGIYQHENLLMVTGGIMDRATGAKSDYGVVNTVDVYDYTIKQWNRIAALQLPLAVRSHKLVASGDYIYLVAGATMIPARVEDGDQHFNSQAWRARWSDIKAAAKKGVSVQPSFPERSVWTPIADPPVRRSTVISHDNTILLVGGLKEGLPQNSIYRFVTEKAINRWIKVGSMDMGRYRHAVVPLPAFFIAGGYVKSKPEEDEANVKTQDVDIVLFAPVEKL